MSYAKCWLFTINNPTELLDLEDIPDVKRAVYQEEIGENGTHHLQGFVVFNKRKRITQVKEAIDDRAHLEVAKGTQMQNYKYCTKDDTRVAGSEPDIIGDWLNCGQGTRTDILSLRDAVRDGKTFTEIADDDELTGALARSMRFYERLESDTVSESARRPGIYCTLHYGPAGTGKSHCAGCDGDPKDVYMYDGGFWDGYKGQPTVILDEIGGHTCSPLTLNRVLDKYPYQANIKGRSAPMVAERIHLTSNYLPRLWWGQNTKFSEEALYRRIHEAHWHYDFKKYRKYVTDEEGTACDKMISDIARKSFVHAQ